MNMESQFEQLNKEIIFLKYTSKITRFCLYQCNNNFAEGDCYKNCHNKWNHARLLAQSQLEKWVEVQFQEAPK